jgi:ATP-dependent helicase HrpA
MSRRRPDDTDRLFARLDEARLADAGHLAGRLRRVRRLTGDKRAAELQEIGEALEVSILAVQERRASIATIAYPPELPISSRAGEIADAIRRHPTLVLCGETGSGKSTQLPKICLEAGFGSRGLVGHTQPRRIAARSVAARIAQELGGPLGREVGYKIRFADRTGPDCRIKLMTDGILLAEIQRDPNLRQYDALIIDEAHERSLNIDFLLGYLKRIRPKRPDLRVIVTSATIDPERLSSHFDDAPVIEVSGRTYPVEVRYRPPVDEEDWSQTDAVMDAVRELEAGDGGRGDVLVFLAGEREIRETAVAIRKHLPGHLEVLPLFSRLSSSEQDRIFAPSRTRRILLATNIAETSLTVPGVRYVIDPGRARISRYAYRSKIQRLQIEPVSQASAEQRKGRCGRLRDGVCVRLFSEEDYAARPEFTDPEILRTNLASVILQMECMGLGTVEKFPFVDAPDSRFVNDGYRLLREIGAVDERDRVTRLGRMIARFPLDPRLGRILMAAAELGCLREALPIAAALSIQDPRERPAEARQQADERHAQWRVENSDFLAFLMLWDAYVDRRHHLSVNKQRRWCRDNFLAIMRMRDWYDVHQQLHAQARELGLAINSQPAEPERVHQALLTGLVGHVGQRDEKEYRGPRGGRFVIFPGSGLRGTTPAWIMAASLVETSRVFAHTVARVEPAWVEQAAPHLVKRAYEDPRWDSRRGHVTAREQVSLYGLVLAAGRRVDFGRIDPVAARAIFIRDGLAGDAHGIEAPFAEHNRAMLAEAQALEARLRRRDIVADAARIAAFYDRILPPDVRDRKGLQRWRKGAEKASPKLLFMDREDVLATDAPVVDTLRYPHSVAIEGNRIEIAYRFEPGHPADGVTLLVPRTLLPMLEEDRLEWLIPGLLEEKVTAMIRALPKSLRRRLVPAPDVARRCMDELEPEGGIGLRTALAALLQREAGVPIGSDAWADSVLPDHLSFNIRVIDADGEPLDESRSLPALQATLGARGPIGRIAAGRQFRGMTAWDAGDISPTSTEPVDGDGRRLFPALHDDGDSVSLARFASRAEAIGAHRRGTLRLFRLSCRQQESYLRKEISKTRVPMLLAGLASEGGDPVDDLLGLAFGETFLPDADTIVHNAEEFDTRLAAGRPRLVGVGTELTDLVARIVGPWRSLKADLDARQWGRALDDSRADLEWQLDRLLWPGWLTDTPARWLQEFPRYLEAVRVRMEKIDEGDPRERTHLERLRGPIEKLVRWELAGRDHSDAAIGDYRWMLEEFRVSIFAQPLGTSMKVSDLRLEREWERAMTAAGLDPAGPEV